MQRKLPALNELGIRVPTHLKPQRFTQGFNHALCGGQIDQVEYLKLSFREGFRTAKLYLREVQRRRGVLSFPIQAQLRFSVH